MSAPFYAGPDRRLLALTDVFQENDTAWRAMIARHGHDDIPRPGPEALEFDLIQARARDLAQMIGALRAHTIEGARAKAACALAHFEQWADGKPAPEDRLAWSLARDLARADGPLAAPPAAAAEAVAETGVAAGHRSPIADLAEHIRAILQRLEAMQDSDDTPALSDLWDREATLCRAVLTITPTSAADSAVQVAIAGEKLAVFLDCNGSDSLSRSDKGGLRDIARALDAVGEYLGKLTGAPLPTSDAVFSGLACRASPPAAGAP